MSKIKIRFIDWTRTGKTGGVGIYGLPANEGDSGEYQIGDELEVSERTVLRDIDQLSAAGVPVFVKQLGSHPHTTRKGRVACMAPRWCGVGDWDRRYVLRDRKGGAPAEWPEDMRVREMPGTPR